MTSLNYIPCDNLQLAVEILGEGRPLIWAHGLSGWRQSGINKFRHLANRYQIIAFDQRGHGRSTPVTDPSLYSVERMASDIGAILDHLGLEHAIVGGESMGAATALALALSSPQRVQSLLLVSPAFGDAPNQQREISRERGSLITSEGMEAYLAQMVTEQRAMGLSEELVAYLDQVRRSHNPASLSTALQTVINWVPFDDLSPLNRLNVPVYFIAWQNDPLHPLALAQRMAATIPHAQLTVISSIKEFFLNPAGIGDLCNQFLERQNA